MVARVKVTITFRYRPSGTVRSTPLEAVSGALEKAWEPGRSGEKAL